MIPRYVLLGLAVARLSVGMCPFRREAAGSPIGDISEERLAEILARINVELPDHFPHEEEKRATGFDPVGQRIDVSGQHAWQAPGPNDTYAELNAPNYSSITNWMEVVVHVLD